MDVRFYVCMSLPIFVSTFLAWGYANIRYGRRVRSRRTSGFGRSVAAQAAISRRALGLWVTLEIGGLMLISLGASLHNLAISLAVAALGFYLWTKTEFLVHLFYLVFTGELSSKLRLSSSGSYKFPDSTSTHSVSAVSGFIGTILTAFVLVVAGNGTFRLLGGGTLVFVVPLTHVSFHSSYWVWTVVQYALAVGLYAILTTLEHSSRRRASARRLRRVETGQESVEVLYLRPFAIDRVRVRSRRSPRQPWYRVVLPVVSDYFEDIILWQFWEFGAVSALTDVERAGAATSGGATRRDPMAHGEWRQQIAQLFDRAKVIVLVPDESEGVRWELEQIRASPPRLAKTIIVQPPPARSRSTRTSVDTPLVTMFESGETVDIYSSAAEDIDYESAIEAAIRALGLVEIPAVLPRPWLA